MTNPPIHGRITGPIVMIGFGSIGKGMLPLIERHFEFDRSRLVVIDPDDKDPAHARRAGHPVRAHRPDAGELSRSPAAASHGRRRAGFLREPVGRHLVARHPGTVRGNSGALYIDTVAEPWVGFYFDKCAGPEARTNYALREIILDARRRNPGGPTAVSCCGANPGMVSWLVKQALLNLAKDIGLEHDEPKSREDWARLMSRVGVKGIHIAERDTQRATSEKPMGVFVNTWSVEGFVSEGLQPAELGLGDARDVDARERPHARDRLARRRSTCSSRERTRCVRSWTPTAQAPARVSW